MPHESSAAEQLDNAPSSERRVKQKLDVRPRVERSSQQQAHVDRVGRRVEHAASVLGRDRAEEIWDRATTFLTHAGHEPLTKAIHQQATEYVFEAAGILERYLNNELDDAGMQQAISGLNTRMNMPENYNPILETGKSQPRAMRSLEAGAGERAPRLEGARTRIGEKPRAKTFAPPVEAPEPVAGPEEILSQEIEEVREEETKLLTELKAIKEHMSPGARLTHWWQKLRGAPASSEHQWLRDLEHRIDDLRARRFLLEEERQMGTYIKTLGRTVKDFFRSIPIPGMETAAEREERERERRHGIALAPGEFSDVSTFERSLHGPKLSELMQDSSFQRANTLLGNTKQREAIAFFQTQRGKNIVNIHDSDPEIVDQGPVWDFMRALSDYVEARQSRNTSEVSRNRLALTKLGEDNGIPAHEMLRLVASLMETKTAQSKARKSGTESPIDHAA